MAIACVNGQLFTTASLDVISTASPGKTVSFLMQNILVAAYSDGGIAGQEILLQNVTLNTGSVKIVLRITGDANADGKFDASDLNSTLKVLTGQVPQSQMDPLMVQSLDVVPPGGDGVIDARDINKLLRIWLDIDKP